MRFMMIYKPADTTKMEAGVPPSRQEMARMGQFIGELASSGVLVATDGLLPSSKGARVKLSAGNVAVTDGPFTETKELIAGFAIMQLPSIAEAIEMAKRFLAIAGDGESEIRQMYDQPAFPRPVTEPRP
ncbi:MAG: YciI family protein [Bryobacteraceae bacterium]